jgi:Uma2 family endonuclease
MTPATITPPPVPPTVPSVTAAPPAPRVGLTPHRWTIEEYRKLGPTRIFDGKKTMLIDGEIYAMPFPDPPHNLSLGLAADWLATVFASGHHVRNQMAFDIGTGTDPGPDLAVVVGTRRDYADRQPTTAVLVVEVADSSLAFDTTEKAEKYAAAGVPDYWVIDLVNRQLIVFRNPQPLPKELGATAYQSRTTHGPEETIAPLAAPQATIRVADLLP